MSSYPYFIAGEWRESQRKLEVRSPYDGSVVGETYYADSHDAEKAVRATANTFQTTRRMPSHERASILSQVARAIEERKAELARLISLEAGKPIKDASVEADRAVLTFRTAAEEAKRVYGEFIPLDFNAASNGRAGIVKRFPLGPVLAITPFNFPLNLVAHKLAPAMAAGNPVVVKPSPRTPLSALLLTRIVAEAGWPDGALSTFVTEQDTLDRLIADERFKMLSFTGSAAVGWMLKAKAGKKRVTLELGGNAGAIVDQDADLAHAARRITAGGFSYAGQSCISVQRTYVHESVFEEFTHRFVDCARALKLGASLNPDTDLGPMIDAGAAKRTETWVREAIGSGAKVLLGGKSREHNIFEPTILTDADPESNICRMEVFAPVVLLFPFREFEQAVAAVNDSDYGLQAGVFTSNLDRAFYTFERLDVGGVIINDVPSWRMDPMPYGGIKDSGFGREGVRYAIEEMTERKIMVLRLP